jgi:hypothetical protein
LLRPCVVLFAVQQEGEIYSEVRIAENAGLGLCFKQMLSTYLKAIEVFKIWRVFFATEGFKIFRDNLRNSYPLWVGLRLIQNIDQFGYNLCQ